METNGPMVGCDTAITWVENLKNIDTEIRDRIVRRMRYEFQKDIPVKPKFTKGKYSSRYDSWKCGNCGTTISEAWHKYCPNCGYAIGKKEIGSAKNP